MRCTGSRQRLDFFAIIDHNHAAADGKGVRKDGRTIAALPKLYRGERFSLGGICNRYRFSAKQADVMRACGFEPPYPENETYPVPREIFPTRKKIARHGLVVR